ncbi:DUF4376 domain-containing protein [Halomonas sp. GT]|uniref:DUF4376 domain-containing protein n=1 Tax=Halomonas sp. GT TaxID=1971364 RepID=UPI0009F72E52|nr:DUF4376 domain-containing protein [Halomonas sp. GT]
MQQIYWSATAHAFFHSSIHGAPLLRVIDPAWQPDENNPDDIPPMLEVPNPDTKVPKDAVEVDADTHEALMNGQTTGLNIISDEHGRPTLAEPPAATIQQLATQKRRELNAARDAAFAQGMEYNFNGETDVVQTRPEDQLNLIALSAKAQRMIAAGHPDATLTFRGAENVNREITATEMDALTMAALAHIEGIYQKSWQLKDALDNAEREQDRDAIEALNW